MANRKPREKRKLSNAPKVTDIPLFSIMLSRLAAVVFLTSSYWSSQAQIPDSLLEKHTQRHLSLDTLFQQPTLPDTLGNQQFHALDSIQSATTQLFDNLKNSYDSVTSVADKAASGIQHQMDSLNNLNLPTTHLTGKLDSIAQWKSEKLSGIQTKVNELKTKASEKINSLELPEELTDKSKELTSAVDKLDVSLPNTSLPNLNLGNDLSPNLPGLKNPFPGQSLPDINNPIAGQTLPDINNPLSGQQLPNTPNINLPPTDLNGVTGQVSQYTDQIKQNFPTNMEDVSTVVENKAGDVVQIDDVQKQIGEADQLGDLRKLQDEEAMKEKLKEEAKKQAVNHFAGKEEKLQQAMEQMAKYKKKYESVQSLADLPKKKGNPLHNKPFIERLVPGIALHIHRKDAWMVDFNPYVGYKFTTRITAGLGWNHRIAYNFDINSFQQQLHIFGPRVFGEYKLGKGFTTRLEAEYMKAFVPSQFSSGHIDSYGREWVFSTMAGLKKEYRFIKNVRGTVMLLYNLYDPRHRSPYQEKLNMRFGFEFPLKAKPKS